MKAGDLVRFWPFNEKDPPVIGLLVEYHTWEKIASVLWEGEIHRVRAEHVEKAGRKDVNP